MLINEKSLSIGAAVGMQGVILGKCLLKVLVIIDEG